MTSLVLNNRALVCNSLLIPQLAAICDLAKESAGKVYFYPLLYVVFHFLLGLPLCPADSFLLGHKTLKYDQTTLVTGQGQEFIIFCNGCLVI